MWSINTIVIMKQVLITWICHTTKNVNSKNYLQNGVITFTTFQLKLQRINKNKSSKISQQVLKVLGKTFSKATGFSFGTSGIAHLFFCNNKYFQKITTNPDSNFNCSRNSNSLWYDKIIFIEIKMTLKWCSLD